MESLQESDHLHERKSVAPQTPEQTELIHQVERLFTESDREVVRLLSRYLKKEGRGDE